MMKQQMVYEFITETGASQPDALSCLSTWNWDFQKALIDYRDTSTREYLSEKRTEEITPSFWSTEDTEKLLPAATTASDISQNKKLARRISRADDNVSLVSQARGEFSRDSTKDCISKRPCERLDPADYTFSLPDLFVYPDNFRRFLERDLIENSTLVALEQAHRLNWWTNLEGCTKMWPLSTTGDGNCLLHAASLAIWGFHDRKLSLRSELFHVMSSPTLGEAFERRWRFQQTRINKSAGFVFSDAEWRKEWEAIVLMASPEPREVSTATNLRRYSFPIDRKFDGALEGNAAAVYESLEEIHVLVLAHVLRRTIIVIADTVLRDLNGEAMAPIPFGGIYMPLEVNPNECQREPLILAYDMAHFSALVRMDTKGDRPNFLVPLTDNTHSLLPIQFGIDPGRDFDWTGYDGTEGNYRLTEQEKIALLSEYMNVVTVRSRANSDDTIYRDWIEEDALEKEINDIEITLAIDETDQPKISEPGAREKNPAGKQLNSVAKQFGSIGKNMSKKIKKNIESFTKMGGGSKHSAAKKFPTGAGDPFNGHTTRTTVVCAQIRVKHHEFYEAMIKNYLECAQERFVECELKDDGKNGSGGGPAPPTEINGGDYMVNCISDGCVKFGTVDTSYLCPECYENQKQREFNCSYFDQVPRYGTGNSKFYTQADMESHKKITRIPSVKRLNELDQTIYLSNSTFFNDKLAPNDAEMYIKVRQEGLRDKTQAILVAKENRRQKIASIYDNLCPEDCDFQYCTKCTDMRHRSKEVPDISL
ncbi:OTU domain-containing protein 7B-like isoform X2 [Lutzomyia longipalpis]|nr:OTU domain-containing protein 7B-like isoform X2 [Lutzomyia longipalpis]XP_055681151.1 OTU domain-containing protein 7B-like isoform X2 [Lutzomyia longipalpis]XP_055681161.1 OTU domain-containing protein 7B-like isoform X2 [Lutzomyia longipalpis]XP_055681172.1 OTU domain-containing protein 7B-like isoform X2 [Lutzomyia longipalpis]